MDNWQITEDAFDLQKMVFKESVFTIGNGYLGTRGAFEESYPGEQAATLVHGVFDDIPIVFTELANAPNWLHLHITVNGRRFRMNHGEVLDYHRVLDLRTGVIRRSVRWRSPGGETLSLDFERFTSLADEHVLALRCRITALDFNGTVEIQAGTPGHIDNDGFVHWTWLDQGRAGERSHFLCLQTKATEINLCEAAHLHVSGGRELRYDYWDSQWIPTEVARVQVESGNQITVEKLVTIYTSRDTGDPRSAALQKLAEIVDQGYDGLRADNDAAWKREWEDCNITIRGDDEADRSLRYSLFQLLIAGPRHDDRVSIPAKALSGYGYRGHVFWDTEIFILPFFIHTRPQIARNLLMYRYHTLPAARQKALAHGFEGAMFPWESAATGEETTPRWVPGPKGKELVRIWTGDIEHHITADIAYAILQYWRVSGDDDFLREYGAEIILETARFWVSRAEWNPEQERYEYTNVIGPDEYHDHVDNNAYTNVFARWNIHSAMEIWEWLQENAPRKAGELEESLGLSADTFAEWQEVSQKIYVHYNPETKIFEQFDGYFDLKDIDLEEFEPRSESIQTILGIEGTAETQILKQPDVLMMLYLLRDEFDREVMRANWDYYTPRSDLTFGSSLGPAIQATLAARMGDIQAAYYHFMHAVRTDLDDIRGNAAHGIHAATDGGIWQAVVYGFSRMDLVQEGPRLEPRVNPHLPEHWTRLQFRIFAQDRTYEMDLRPSQPDLQGAIFDLDGVITDTSEYHFRAWKRLAEEEGIPFSREENEALRGVSRRQSLQILLKGRTPPEEDIQEMMARKNRYYLEFIDQLTEENLLPGARELLEELRGMGFKIGIGSASKNARGVIEKLGVRDLIDSISDGYSVERQKPAPDLFLHAAGQLQLPPQNCVVFEDARSGVQAALDGGLWSVGLGPEERVGAAHAVFANLDGVRWEEVLEKLTLSRVVCLDALPER